VAVIRARSSWTWLWIILWMTRWKSGRERGTTPAALWTNKES
jgi:hypothetical protein